MAKSGYVATTSTAISLSANTPRSVLGVKSGATTANHGVDLKKIRVSFAGTSASDEPVVVDLCACTFATNGPGTNSDSVTVRQAYGRLAATGFSAAEAWDGEPTVLTVLETFMLTPNGGTLFYDWPLGESPDSALGEGFVLRCEADDAVDLHASMWFERC